MRQEGKYPEEPTYGPSAHVDGNAQELGSTPDVTESQSLSAVSVDDVASVEEVIVVSHVHHDEKAIHGPSIPTNLFGRVFVRSVLAGAEVRVYEVQVRMLKLRVRRSER